MSADERVQQKIDSLLAGEDDKVRREFMLVLQNINRNLTANTIATEQTQRELANHRAEFAIHLENFSKHAIDEEAIMNKGKGAWRVMAYVLSAVQAVAIWGWIYSRGEIESMKVEAHAAELIHQKLQIRIEQLEKITPEK